MFPGLAAREAYVAETNFVARKQKMFLPQVKNIFASRTQILLPNMFPSLATMKTMLIRFQCCSFFKMFSATASVLQWLTATPQAGHRKEKGIRK